MSRISSVKEQIDALYQAQHRGRADWADWLYKNHVFAVAECARKIADRFGGNGELAMAAGMLHDVADATMRREDERHGKESERLAREILHTASFSPDEIGIIVDDAIKHHSCRHGQTPQSHEGKIMSTADAIVHLQTNFYNYGVTRLRETKTAAEIQNWALPKIERDFHSKIAFEEVREEVHDDYERWKKFFTEELH